MLFVRNDGCYFISYYSTQADGSLDEKKKNIAYKR